MSSRTREMRSMTMLGLATMLRREEDPYDKYCQGVGQKLSSGSDIRIFEIYIPKTSRPLKDRWRLAILSP